MMLSNSRPTQYECDALPTDLLGHKLNCTDENAERPIVRRHHPGRSGGLLKETERWTMRPK